MTSAKKIKNSDNPRPVYTTIQFQSDPHSPASLDVLYGFDPPPPQTLHGHDVPEFSSKNLRTKSKYLCNSFSLLTKQYLE